MKKIKRRLLYIMFMSAMLFLLRPVAYSAYAAEETEESSDMSTTEPDLSNSEVKFRQAVADENKIKVYIRGADTSQSMSYQISSIPVSTVEIYNVNEDRIPMRTLIMLDNSISIPSGSRSKITELLNGIVDAHNEKEVFRLATFSDSISYLSDTYSDDYTVLKNAIASISYKDQETYLTDVLYDLVDDLNNEAYMGYTRVIIVSDGVDNKQLGVTREELNAKLKETPYPVYTVGTLTGKNNDQLENMFALSRLTNSEYFVLENADTSAIVSELSKDSQMTVVEAVIPDAAKNGGKQSSKLTFSNGTQLVFDVHMPFHVQAVQQEPIKEEVESVPEPTQPLTEPEEPVEEKGISTVMIAGIAGAVLLIIVVAVIVVIVVKKKKAGNDGKGEADTAGEDVPTETDTVIVGGSDDRGGILPTSDAAKSRYRVKLYNSGLSQVYQCELKNSISIGKASGNDIVINAATISRRHCIMTNRNGRIFIQDLNSTNGTFVNNERINFDTEIFSGATVRLGREELTVKFEQV